MTIKNAHYIAAAVLTLFAAGVQSQEIARLYAPQAPAGSSYLRVVNPAQKTVKVEFGGKQDVLDPKQQAVSLYRVISAAGDIVIKVDGRALESIRVKPDSFNTVVLNGTDAVLVINDATDGRNDLKAQLRFYNLARDCNATLALQDGAAIFEQVTYGNQRKRAINPVQARLQGRCDSVHSSAVAMPALKAGDHASFFLLGDAKNVRLIGQLDATEAFAGAR